MSLVRKVLAGNRIRQVKRRLAKSPSPSNYLSLAQAYALLGRTAEVVRVCQEGLAVFPGSAELARMSERARRLERETRLAELKREMRDAPRPALWREKCEILFESGQFNRAEESAKEWLAAANSDEAKLMLAQVRVKRFLADRSRDLGRKAIETLEEVLSGNPGEGRAWTLQMQLASRIGAWKEARRCCAKLLELEPGNPVLEARFRTFDALSDGAPEVDRALLEVERTGRLAGEGASLDNRGAGTNVRPMLRQLESEPGVHSALYVRGGTALVQGQKGATAERTARAVRNILQSSRSTGRKLGLGQLFQIQVEGDFGTLGIAPGEMDAGAIWSQGSLTRSQETALAGLAGLEADMHEDES